MGCNSDKIKIQNDDEAAQKKADKREKLKNKQHLNTENEIEIENVSSEEDELSSNKSVEKKVNYDNMFYDIKELNNNSSKKKSAKQANRQTINTEYNDENSNSSNEEDNPKKSIRYKEDEKNDTCNKKTKTNENQFINLDDYVNLYQNKNDIEEEEDEDDEETNKKEKEKKNIKINKLKITNEIKNEPKNEEEKKTENNIITKTNNENEKNEKEIINKIETSNVKKQEFGKSKIVINSINPQLNNDNDKEKNDNDKKDKSDKDQKSSLNDSSKKKDNTNNTISINRKSMTSSKNTINKDEITNNDNNKLFENDEIDYKLNAGYRQLNKEDSLKLKNGLMPKKYKYDDINNNNKNNTEINTQKINIQTNNTKKNNLHKNNKSKSLKSKLKIDEAQNEKSKEYKIRKVKCDIYEQCTNIWVSKDEAIKFRVFGTWTPDPKLKPCTCNGISTYTTSGFNFGSLIGRILAEDYFLVSDFGVYICPREGPLYFKMYCPRRNKLSKGFLTVHIFGGVELSREEIDQRIGWDNTIYSNFLISNNNNIISANEAEILIELNKMRTYPKLYAVQYVSPLKFITNNFLYEIEKMSPLILDENFIQATLDFRDNYINILRKKDLRKNLQHLDEVNAIFRLELEKKYSKFISVIKYYEDTHPHKIALNMLNDAELREVIFNQYITNISLKLLPVPDGNEGVMVCIVFSHGKENVADYNGNDNNYQMNDYN